MPNTDPYLDYWRNQQKQQQAHNQYLVQQTRKNLETIIQYLIQTFPIKKIGVAESNYECQFCTYPKVSLSLGFKNSTKEDSYLKSATPKNYPLWFSRQK
jgi:hypothetical protein